MNLASQLSIAFLFISVCIGASTADDNNMSLLNLKKEQTQIQYVVATVKGDCHDSEAAANRSQLSEAAEKYALASSAYNAWLKHVREAISKPALLTEEGRDLWSKANETTRAFVDYSLKACGGIHTGDPMPEPLKSGQLLVSFEDMQALVKKLQGSSPKQRKSTIALLLGDEWDASTLSGKP